MNSSERPLKLALLIWLILLTLSLVIPNFIQPEGSSFVRGMNRLVPSFWLQVIGLLIAGWTCVVAFRTRTELPTWLRISGFVPILLYITAVLALLVLAPT